MTIKLSPVLYQVSRTESDRGRVMLHWCPGCNCPHAIHLTKPDGQGMVYKFDGQINAPTFRPEVFIVGLCHYKITNGSIEFFMDCAHALAGMVVPMVEFDLSDSAHLFG